MIHQTLLRRDSAKAAVIYGLNELGVSLQEDDLVPFDYTNLLLSVEPSRLSLNQYYEELAALGLSSSLLAIKKRLQRTLIDILIIVPANWTA